MTARLVVLTPGGAPQEQVLIDQDRLLLGRDPHGDVALDDPGVSWHHAEVTCSAGQWFVRDLGSTNGTTVASVPITQPTVLQDGAVIGLGPARVRFEDPSSAGLPPLVTAVPPPPLPPPSPALSSPQSGPLSSPLPAPQAPPATGGFLPDGSAVLAPPTMTIGVIRGREINAVEGVQYISHVQQVLDQRRSFLRAVAATRTWARRLIWPGFVLMVLGFAAVLPAVLTSLDAIFGSVSSGVPPDPAAVDVFGTEVGGLPVVALGYGAVFLGGLLVVVGIVLHVVATARLSRLDKQFAIPRLAAHHHLG